MATDLQARAMTAEEEITLGRRAKGLLNDEMFQKVFEHLMEQTVADWRKSTASATEQREALFFQVHGLEAIKGQLTAWADDGDYAAAQIEKADKAEKSREAGSKPA